MAIRKERRTATACSEGDDASSAAQLRQAHDFLPTVADAELASSEHIVLNLARCFCHGIASGDLEGWEYAFQLADDGLGLADGPVFAARVCALIRALRRERQGEFGFMRPGCCRICEDEASLLALVRAARAGQHETLKVAIERLRTVPWPERTLLAALSLAGLCRDFDREQGIDDAAPPARHALN